MRKLLALSALLLAIGGGVDRLRAQVTAAVSGTVTDTSGAAVAEAVVEVQNTGTAITRPTVTDAQGRFLVPDLPIGVYDVQAAKPGFETVVHKGVTLTVGSNPVVDFSLPVGQTQQTVNVVGDVSQVDTASSAVSNLVEQTEMRELPLNGRNYAQLITLAPGIMSFPNTTTSTLYGQQQNYSISGQRPVGFLYLLDDTNTAGYFNHGGGAGALGTSLGIDAIDQFQTLTNTYSAQFGGSGAVI